ncbi:MAG TPA: hypothetical protein VH107_01410 [Lacipirellulaceae bacterium]|jgi:hypothetical protein|nr:hypothetical protein [Lacipirellulaceae bacterium]
MPTDHRHDLRSLLESLATEVDEFTPAKAAESELTIRDCRLELLRRAQCQLSDVQLHRLKQLEYRLQMVVTGHGESSGIAPEAKRALNSFGWSPHS